MLEFDQTESLPSQHSSSGDPISVSAPSAYSHSSGRQYVFAGWHDGDITNPRTMKDNSNIYALYKLVHKSNTVTAFTNSSQRKLVRTKDNWLHQVYESMGHVWIEHSSNNGSTWILGNDGKPLDNGGGKCPSIDWDYNRNYPNNSDYYSLVAVFQEPYGSTYKIQYAVFKYTSGSYVRQVTSSLRSIQNLMEGISMLL